LALCSGALRFFSSSQEASGSWPLQETSRPRRTAPAVTRRLNPPPASSQPGCPPRRHPIHIARRGILRSRSSFSSPTSRRSRLPTPAPTLSSKLFSQSTSLREPLPRGDRRARRPSLLHVLPGASPRLSSPASGHSACSRGPRLARRAGSQRLTWRRGPRCQARLRQRAGPPENGCPQSQCGADERVIEETPAIHAT